MTPPSPDRSFTLSERSFTSIGMHAAVRRPDKRLPCWIDLELRSCSRGTPAAETSTMMTKRQRRGGVCSVLFGIAFGIAIAPSRGQSLPDLTVSCSRGAVTVQAHDVGGDRVMRAVADSCGATLHGDPLSVHPVTLSLVDASVSEVIERLVGRGGRSFVLRYDGHGIHSISLLSQTRGTTAPAGVATPRPPAISLVPPITGASRNNEGIGAGTSPTTEAAPDAIVDLLATIDGDPSLLPKLMETLDELEPEDLEQVFENTFGADGQEVLEAVTQRIVDAELQLLSNGAAGETDSDDES
jgi:hypothetical protein